MTVAELEQLIGQVTEMVYSRIQAYNQSETLEVAALSPVIEPLEIAYLSCTDMCEIANWTPVSTVALRVVEALKRNRPVIVYEIEYTKNMGPGTLKIYRWRQRMQDALDSCMSYGIQFLKISSSYPSKKCGQIIHAAGVNRSSKNIRVERKIYTLQSIEAMMKAGEVIPEHARLTPLAADYVRQHVHKGKE